MSKVHIGNGITRLSSSNLSNKTVTNSSINVPFDNFPFVKKNSSRNLSLLSFVLKTCSAKVAKDFIQFCFFSIVNLTYHNCQTHPLRISSFSPLHSEADRRNLPKKIILPNSSQCSRYFKTFSFTAMAWISSTDVSMSTISFVQIVFIY